MAQYWEQCLVCHRTLNKHLSGGSSSNNKTTISRPCTTQILRNPENGGGQRSSKQRSIILQTLNISFFLIYYYIISFAKKRYNIIYIISWIEWYDRISYIIILSFQKKLKLAIFYILFINTQSSKHTKRRSQLSLIIFYSKNWTQIDIKKSRQEHSSFKFMARKFEAGPEMKNDIKMI
jgi:hypothetical protein